MDFVRQLKTQYTALRTAALAAGPGAPVPTCPGWTVHDLVRHMASVHSWVLTALRTPADSERPRREHRPPEPWDDLLPWWDARFGEVAGLLADTDPATPTWTFAGPGTYGFWARRQAHETAVHRLDAEHARYGDAVPTLLFDPDFAADGVDEFLGILVLTARERPIGRAGRVLFHAADAGRAWEVRLTPGEPPVVGPVEGSGTAADAAVAGTADAVYRAAWGRPGGAVVSGDRSLVDDLPRP